MFIEYVILEGFKSYAQRVKVGPFDEHFNAITGRNGTGKSNILDGICFVMGISTLNQVRVNSLQELVYKQGQAGITKASVTLVFNNKNKEQSPVGFEQHDEITITRVVVIGGRNKYLINGHNAQPSRVQNLFHSVSLNVNNPHFLIMQGRIRKVLAMKPNEVLGMIEEAAGTAMFEAKKQSAERTIEKKEQKMAEITQILNDDIKPKLDALRASRAIFTQWSENAATLERLQRLAVAMRYTSADDMVRNGNKHIERASSELATIDADLRAKHVQISGSTDALDKLVRERERGMNDTYRASEKDASEKAQAAAQASAQLANTKSELAAEAERQQTLAAKVAQLTAELATHESGVLAAKRELDDASAEHQRLVDLVAQQERLVGDGANGATGAGAASFEDQMRVANEAIRSASVRLAAARRSLESTMEELKKTEALAKSAGAGDSKLSADLAAARTELDAVVQQLKQQAASGSAGASQDGDTSVATLRAERQAAMAHVQALESECDRERPALQWLQFSFDGSGAHGANVHGTIARLLRAKDEKFLTALDTIAGGRLGNIVVEDEATAKLILKSNTLKRRVTLLPLDKMNARALGNDVVAAAEGVAGRGNVWPALSLISFERKVEPAMRHVFGGTLVCRDMEVARKVAYHPQCRCRCVTLDGTVVEPAGTVTGGGQADSVGTLLRMAKLLGAEEALVAARAKLAAIDEKLRSARAQADRGAELDERRAQLEAKIVRLDEQLSRGEAGRAVAHATKLRESIEANRAEVARLDEHIESQKGVVKQITAQLQGAESDRKRAQKEAAEHLAELKKTLKKAAARLQKAKNDDTKLSVLLDKTQAALKAAQAELAECEDELGAQRAALVQREAAAAQTSAAAAAAQAAFDKLRARIVAADAEIGELRKRREQLERQVTELELKLKQANTELKRFQEEAKQASTARAALERANEWIATEKQYFGRANTDFDFGAQTLAEVEQGLAKLQRDQETIARKINRRVMAMFERAEQEYNDLVQKKDIIANDKQKIQAVIQELEEKKIEALQKTWQKVNKDFASIFSMLLPGASCKLEPPEGKLATDGLEIRVQLGKVWKESLTELSGGQKSLLALSLILSLLLFKPAPVYMLDEVDAALDLSHTQNIGRIIRKHFNQSQFIIISLKNGMFNNANVIFRTQFVDNHSAVTRIEPGKAGALLDDGDAASEQNDEDGDELADSENAAAAKRAPAAKAGAKRLALQANASRA